MERKLYRSVERREKYLYLIILVTELIRNSKDNNTFDNIIYNSDTFFSLLYSMEEILEPQITVKLLQIMVLES